MNRMHRALSCTLVSPTGTRSAGRTRLLLGMHQLIEVASLSGSSLFLIHKLQVIAVEFLKEIIPRNFAETLVVFSLCLWEAESQDSRLIFPMSAGHFSGHSPARLGPTADLLMILRGL